jgi:predicted membrane-bound spermidine synthase
MIEKIVGLIFAIAGSSAGLFFIGIGAFLIKTYSDWVVWLAFIAIFCFSALIMFISLCPLIGSFEKTNTESDYCPSEPDPPVEPEKEKMGFFAPFELV